MNIQDPTSIIPVGGKGFKKYSTIFLMLLLVLPHHSQPPTGGGRVFDVGLRNQEAKLNSSYKMKCRLNDGGGMGMIFWTVDGHIPNGNKHKIKYVRLKKHCCCC
jgi:hypothetical protein